jgi:hypothetical protein
MTDAPPNSPAYMPSSPSYQPQDDSPPQAEAATGKDFTLADKIPICEGTKTSDEDEEDSDDADVDGAGSQPNNQGAWNIIPRFSKTIVRDL